LNAPPSYSISNPDFLQARGIYAVCAKQHKLPYEVGRMSIPSFMEFMYWMDVESKEIKKEQAKQKHKR